MSILIPFYDSLFVVRRGVLGLGWAMLDYKITTGGRGKSFESILNNICCRDITSHARVRGNTLHIIALRSRCTRVIFNLLFPPFAPSYLARAISFNISSIPPIFSSSLPLQFRIFFPHMPEFEAPYHALIPLFRFVSHSLFYFRK